MIKLLSSRAVEVFIAGAFVGSIWTGGIEAICNLAGNLSAGKNQWMLLAAVCVFTAISLAAGFGLGLGLPVSRRWVREWLILFIAGSVVDLIATLLRLNLSSIRDAVARDIPILSIDLPLLILLRWNNGRERDQGSA